MNLYFLRHGKAEEHSVAVSDRERHLVERGVADSTAVAGLLKTRDVRFDAVFTSPYPRASETAKIIAEYLGVPDLLSERPELASGHFGLGSVQKLAAAHGVDASLLFVGHEPDLSHVLELLTGGICDMKTAGLALVETVRPEPNNGVLLWLLPPKLLRSPSI